MKAASKGAAFFLHYHMRLKDIGEDNFIKSLARAFRPGHPRVIKAIGDDASVTLQDEGKALLVTTDVLIEDTHFSLKYTPPYLLGRKALSISLSDIASMGGKPLFYLVSIALNSNTDKKFLDDLYAGLKDVSEKYQVCLIGGNTAKSSKAFVSTTVIGESLEDEVVFRSGAKPGDGIYVTGTLGSSALGLKVLKKSGFKKSSKGAYKKAVSAHLDPAPRVAIGMALASVGLASSMMDISDGLVLDLERLCEESGVSAVLEAEKVPVAAELKRYFRSAGAIYTTALTGGEDYELVFTSGPGNSKKIAALSKKLGLPITPVGKITEKGKAGVKVLAPGGKLLKLRKPGFRHF